ncbi:uncharacterized protein LOC106168381 [Lingula anatina]|uniref:Uncharacterized protein LOC106168381 n=1 Tax=Lingula anatina TaxID=7574 RepID=A0A2R2MQF1_LINAN|nr:uncharacterized protein LOC106168381 [Lingula anatina]|eukprot:XP_023932388.1 uncharacterized protein LOC106168381 [Lingula anatina]
MKPSTHFTLVASFLALLILISRAQGGYVGCYEGRTGGVSAGRYNTSTLDPTTCQTTCGTQQFSYARLYNGRYCFCSNALPSVLVNDSHCDDPCTGDALEKCGGDRHVSVYHVGAEIQGLRVTAGVFTAGVEGAIEVAVTKGSNVVYEVDYGDGTGRTEANATDFDRKTYVMPGRYAVTVYARNADGTYENKSTAVAVSVHEPVQGVQLVCPQLIGVLQEVRCNATVNAGSDMKVTVKYGDMQNETFAIVDAGHSSVGPSIPEHASTVDSTSSNDVHLMPQSEVMDPGTIKAWEYYADVPGTVAFLIFRPKCPTGEQYCHVENICNSTCTLSPRQHSCSNGLFSSVRGSCVNATGGVSTEPDRSSARPPEYTIVESISHVIASRGYGVLSPSNAVDVTYGDVIGYRGIAGLLGTRVTSRGEEPDLNYTAITNAAKGDVLTTSNFAGLVQHRHLLRVVTRRPSNVLIFHKYASEGQYRADFAVSNDKINSTVTVSSQIEVWPAINQTLLDEPPAYAEISKPITFTLLPHTGRNLTYEWTFSDGTAVSTTIPSVTHTYTSIGPHNISVRVFNGLFENSTSSALVIQEPLQGVDIITDHAQLNTLHNITLNVTGGTEYSCDVDFGDDTSVVTVPVSQLVVMVQVGHVYTIGGIHTIIVSCYNMISRVNATHDIPLGVPITGLRFLKESAIVGVPYEITFAIDTGSNVTFELFFAGTPITSVRFNPNTMTGDWGAGLYTSASPSVNELTLRAINTVGTEEISVNFTTEEAIPRPTLSVDHTMFQVGGTATFKLMITAGTSVSIVWDYGDGSRETYSIPVTSAWVQQVPGLSITRNHTYTAGGTPTATIIVANAYSNHTFTQQIDVITPISNLSLASNSPVAYIPPGTASIMVLQGGGAPVAGATIKIDWGDGTAVEFKDLDVGFNYYHEYEAKGTYRVTANVSNPISFMWLETGFLVAEPVTDLRLSTVPPHVPVGQPCVLVLTMYQGENVTFYVDFGDSSGLVTKTREGTTPLDEDTVTHTYSTTGNYTITVIASNMMGNTTKTYVIAVQNPVQNVTFDVSSDAPRLGIGAVQITIDFTTSPPSHDIPSEATISVEWEAGQIDSLPFDCAANCQRVLSHTFSVPGVHTSNVTIYNLASTVTYTVDTSVYETITSIGATAMYQPLIPIGGPDIVGIGPNRVAFPLNRPVKFHVNTSGTVKDYELTAHDENLNVVLHCIHTSWPLTTLFDTANNYTVNITARNPFSSESVVLNIYLGEPVDILEIKENGTTVTGPGENKTFLVVFNSTGSDSCVYVAFDNVPYGVYGWRDACYKNYASSVPYLGVIPVGVLSITTVFPDIGDHQMSVRGFNPFTDTTVNLSFPISNVQCQKPQVSIDQQKELFYDPRVVHMKDSFQLTGITVIKCQVTLLNDKQWTLEEVDGTTGDTIRTIDISSIPSAMSEEIVLPKRYLPYGVYKFTFTVQMRRDQFPEGDIFERSTATHVRVSESPLVVVVLDGGLTKVKRGHGRNITLSPGVYSKDPDLDPTADQGLTQFEYFCRQVGEEFVLTSPTGVIPWDISRANPSSPFTSPPAPNQGGCFGNGPGALNITSGELSFSTGTMLENITYEFIVIVAKGDRKGYASLLVELVSGDPPELTMRCGFGVFCVPTEGGQKIRRSSRIALISDCLAGCDATDMNYTWSLQVQSQEGVYVTWHEIRHIDKYIDGLRGDASYSIGIKRNIYEAKPNIRQVKVTLVARRLTSAQSGSAQLILLVNDPPDGGNCSVSPTVAEVSTAKNWRIECQGWTDEDFIESYKFFALFNGSSVPKNLGFNSRGILDTSMPKGPSYDNYWMTIYTNITDSDGSTTTYKVGRIQVNPMSTTEVQSLVSNLTASGSTNMIAQIAANGNLEDTTQTIQSLASALNTLGSSEGFNSGFGPSEAASTQNTSSAEKEALREEVALIRTQMIEAVADSAPTTPRQVQLLASCLTEVLQQPSEIKRGSQSKVTVIVSGFIDVLQAQAADQTKEETVELATTILSSVGATIAATTYALKNPLPSDVQESMNDMYYDADLENTEQKNVAGLSKEEARNQFGRYTSDESQKEVSGGAVSTLMSGIGNVSDVLLSKTIPGEPSLGVETPQLKMELVKDDPNKIDKLKLQSAKLPSWNSIRPASGPGSGDSLVSVQLVQFASNPFGSLKNSDKVANGSETVSLDLKDDNGATMAISNTQQPIEIFINRDTSGQLPAPDYIYHSPMDPADGLSYRSANITDSDVAIHFEIVPESNVTFLVLVRHGSPPQLQDGEFDFWQLVPSVRLAADGTPLNSYEVFIESDQVGNKTGKYYVGIRQLADNETELYGLQWTNFTGNFTEAFTGANNITTNYTMRTYTSGCYFATVGMTAVSTEGCIVGNKTTHYSTQCYCTHLTSFMGGWVVQPNTIDWNFVFSGAAAFDRNPTLYITEMLIAVLYIMTAIWARRQDKKDVEKLGVSPLPDNDPNDHYLYEMIVFTGMRRNAGTESKVNFILSGEYDETDVRTLADDKRRTLMRGSVDRFLLAVRGPLGDLNYLRIWHDNSGKGHFASWYLKYLLVQDLQTKEKYHFICNRWFAVEEDDGQVDRLLPVAGREQMVEFGHLFTKTTQKNLGDGHLWFSVVARPPRSRFTRLQRVTCCLCLLYMTMLTSAMFYETVPESPGSNAITFGPFSLSPEQIYVGVIGTIIVFPVNLLIVTFFRKAKPRKKRPSRIQAAMQRNILTQSTSTLGGALKTPDPLSHRDIVLEKNERATTYALKNPLPSDVQESMNDMYYDADLENTEQKNVAGLSKDEARNQFGRYTSDESQKGVSGSAVSTLMSGIGNVSDVLLSKTIPGEPSLGVETPQLKMELVKNDANKIDKLNLQSAKLPSWNSIRPASGPGSGDDLVSVQLVQFASNPFGSLKNSDKVANGSETVSLDLKDDNGATMAISNTQQPIEIFINRDTSGQLPVPDYIYHSPMDPADGLSYRSVNITDSDVAIHFEIVPESNVTFLVLVRHGSPPQLQDGEFDFWQLVPSVRLAADGTPLNSYEVFIESDQVGNKTGKYYVGIRQLADNETELYGPQWTNFTGNFTEAFTGANNITTNYTMRTYTSGCYFATVGMTAVSTEGCIVGNKTTHYSTQCYCTHLTSFMGGWVVQPNTIDWNFVFSGAAAFDRNPTLYITEMLIAVLYIMTAIWARRQDKKDVEKLGVSPLPDNDPNDHYLYEMIVFTGMRRNAGTESKVNFILSGEYDETDVRTLADDKRRTLMRGSVDRFLLAVRGPLGDLNYLRIWHDNSGKGQFASWYLKYLLVQDLQTKEKYHFICNRWFAVEEDDGQVDRLLPVAGREQMVEFGHLFTKTTQKNLGDGHLWFSVVARPPRSRFTRLQRVTCCLCLLYMTMLTSAMFYETVPESPGSNAITFGPFSLSPEQIYVGVIGTIIVFPVNLLIVTFFRKAKPRKKRPSRIQAAMQRNILTQSSSTLGGALKTPDPLSHRDIVLEKNERVGENMSMYNQSRSATTVSIQLPSTTPASLTKAYDKGQQSLSNISIPEAFEYKEDAGKGKRKKKKKPLELPWWFTIVAWILMWILILGSAFLVTMYGITFQETKAQKWITSMIISFLTSIFLTEPVKVRKAVSQSFVQSQTESSSHLASHLVKYLSGELIVYLQTF